MAFKLKFGKKRITTVTAAKNQVPLKRKKRVSGNDFVVGNNIINQVIEGDINKIKTLINNGVDLNVVSKLGKTPLILAIDQEKPEIAELLIKSGADVNLAETKFGITPLFYAINTIDWIDDTSMYSKYLSLIKTLIKYGADLNKATYDGITPISRAIDGGDENVKKIVLNGSTSFGRQNKRKSTNTEMSLKTINKLMKYLNTF
jgi:ankyrin repeat protein